MNSSNRKIVKLRSGEMEKFDGLSNLFDRLAAEIQRTIAAGDYENASIVAKELIVIFEMLNQHKRLEMHGAITVPDTENLKPQIAAYLKSIAKDDNKLRLLSAASVDVNLRTALLSS